MSTKNSNPFVPIKVVERVPQFEAILFNGGLNSAKKVILWLQTKAVQAYWKPERTVDGEEYPGTLAVEIWRSGGDHELLNLTPKTWIVFKGPGRGPRSLTFYDQESFDIAYRPAKKSD